MAIRYKCPHCSTETDYLNKERNLDDKVISRKYFVVHRIKDAEGKLIVKNLFRMRLTDFFFLVSLIILLVGFWQINMQCKAYLSDPCEYAAKTNVCSVVKYNDSNMQTPYDSVYKNKLSAGSIP